MHGHEKKDAKGDDGKEWLEEAAGDGDEALAEAVEAGDGEEEYHHSLRCGCIAENKGVSFISQTSLFLRHFPHNSFRHMDIFILNFNFFGFELNHLII